MFETIFWLFFTRNVYVTLKLMNIAAQSDILLSGKMAVILDLEVILDFFF